MDDKTFASIFGLTEQEKADLANAVSQDVTLALDDSNQDDFEQELFDNEMFQDDTEEAA